MIIDAKIDIDPNIVDIKQIQEYFSGIVMAGMARLYVETGIGVFILGQRYSNTPTFKECLSAYQGCKDYSDILWSILNNKYPIELAEFIENTKE